MLPMTIRRTMTHHPSCHFIGRLSRPVIYLCVPWKHNFIIICVYITTMQFISWTETNFGMVVRLHHFVLLLANFTCNFLFQKIPLIYYLNIEVELTMHPQNIITFYRISLFLWNLAVRHNNIRVPPVGHGPVYDTI